MPRPPNRRTNVRSVVLLAALVTATACTTGGSSAPISSSPIVAPAPRKMHDGPLVAFGGSDGVHTLSPDGVGPALLRCRSCINLTSAAWSPDGTHLAFSNADGLWIVDLADPIADLIVRSSRIGDVAWSPDGSRVAFVDDASRILTISPEGGDRTVIVEGSGLADMSWSPDGSNIVYTSSGNELNVAGVYARSKLSSLGRGEHPAWSPDGSSIAYFAVGGCTIRQISFRERGSPVPFNLGSISNRCEDGLDLTWSPDGTELAAMTSLGFTGWGGPLDAVYLVKADGSRARLYTRWFVSGRGVGNGLAWQPVP